MLEKGFKSFLYIVSLALIFGMLYAIYASKPTSVLSDEQEMQHIVSRLNEDLPRPVGTIGYLDSITYSDHTVYYNMSVKEDNGIKQLYTKKYEEIRDLMKYSLLIMNGQKSRGLSLAIIFESKDLNMGVRIYTPDKTFTRWIITGKELIEFATSCKKTPTEALYKVISMQIEIANLDLPMKQGNKPNIQTVALNSIVPEEDESFLLHSISFADNRLFLEFDVDEKDFDLAVVHENKANEEYIDMVASIMAEDADVREFFGMIAIAHSDIVIKCVGQTSGEVAEITLPYHMIKKYCVVPSFMLS